MSNLAPHRGVLILVLGIVGLVICQPVGIAAWVMGNTDLKEIDGGRMDPQGRSLTQVGKILGIISVVILILSILWVAFVLLGVVTMGAAAQ